MATEEELEIKIQTEKAKAALGDLEKELERLREKNGEITIGGAASAFGGALQSAAGQTGSAVGSFAAASPLEKLTQLMEALVSQLFPTALSKLDVISQAQGVEGRIAPFAEAYARRTGQQLPGEVLDSMYAQASTSEGAGRAARARVHALAFRSDNLLQPLEDLPDAIRNDFHDSLRRFWEASGGRWQLGK